MNKKDVKIEHTKAMHTIVKSMNNEDAYAEWVNCMPDEPSEDDFEMFAEEENVELFGTLVNLFVDIMKKYSKDGLFICDKLYAGE